MPSSEITLEALAKRRREEEAAQQAAAADTAPQFTDGAGTQSTVDAAFAATEEAAASLTAAATRTAAEIAAEPGVVVPASDTVAVPNVPSVTSAALVSRSDSQPSELSEDDRRRVEEIKSTIDMLDSNSTMQFGVGAQRNLANFSEAILNQVKVKDAGEVGEAMNNLLANVNSLGIDKFNDRTFRKRGLFRRSSAAIKKFMGRYESVETQIQRIQDQLDGARVGLIRDIGMYDSLYQKNLDYFNELQLYIIAGEEKIAELRNVTIPNLRRQVQEDPDPMNVQLVNDFEEAVDRFEKKVHDLRISRTMAIQTAPQIRLIQNNDKLLVDKIQTAILNVIPLWKSQIVMA
ncbi:MAG: toxic anion resistance protein, partial [Clostridiaceae bacterium]|nr:toxic anion resistance protein [Clostridiaceae bacterium]